MKLNQDDILRELSDCLGQDLSSVKYVKSARELWDLPNIEGIPIVHLLKDGQLDGFYQKVTAKVANRNIVGIADVGARVLISTLPDSQGPTIKDYFDGTEWQSIKTSTFLSIFLFVEGNKI